MYKIVFNITVFAAFISTGKYFYYPYGNHFVGFVRKRNKYSGWGI